MVGSEHVLGEQTATQRFLELFRGLQHQDAHEFLNYLLNDIAETIESKRKTKGQVNGKENTKMLISLYRRRRSKKRPSQEWKYLRASVL